MAKEGASKGVSSFPPCKKLRCNLRPSPNPSQEKEEEIREPSISRAQHQNPAFALESVIYSSCFIIAEPSVDGDYGEVTAGAITIIRPYNSNVGEVSRVNAAARCPSPSPSV